MLLGLLLMLTGAAGGVLGGHFTAAAFAFHTQFAFSLKPVFHVAAIHAAFAFKNLVGTFGNFVTAEHLSIAGAVGGMIAMTVAAVGTRTGRPADRLASRHAAVSGSTARTPGWAAPGRR